LIETFEKSIVMALIAVASCGRKDGRRAKLRLPPSTAVEVSRRQRYTGKGGAREFGVSPATASRILRRLGLNSLNAPARRRHFTAIRAGRFAPVISDRRSKMSRHGTFAGRPQCAVGLRRDFEVRDFHEQHDRFT
jgi:hypothetical protein